MERLLGMPNRGFSLALPLSGVLDTDKLFDQGISIHRSQYVQA